jgi:NAD(P)-dependent dehydrogenase (short-subunit alcohol dehydrogenase family)
MLELMQRTVDNYRTMPSHERLHSLVRKLHREGQRRLRQRDIDQRREERLQDRALLATTQLVQWQRDAEESATALPPAPAQRILNQPEDCYVCKEPYREVHFFYHFLCPACAQFNYSMRSLRADLNGRTALVTGGRVKIGYQLVLRLLRDGARVLLTTRFPHAAARRFEAEPDSADWLERLQIYGLDLRNLPAVEAFAARLLEQESSLEIVVHNAAQTIQRPAGFYQELLAQEESPQDRLSAAALQRVVAAAPTLHDPGSMLPALNLVDVLPLDQLHDREERVDSREVNSWLLPIESVSAREMLEVQLVNSVAPFLLNGRLKPLLLRSPFERRFIVNVSAMEGQFSRHKTVYHPHTNMAKAALNMMTHTCAAGYARERIYMNSVDTGWVTDENPTPMRLRKQAELGFFAPLDIVDGMARIYHPIALGIEDPQTPFYGQFLKDYAPCKW